MKITEIVSPDNLRLKTIRGLAKSLGQKDRGINNPLFLLEGTKLIQEALEKKLELKDIVISQTYFANDLTEQLTKKLDDIIVVPDRIFKNLYSTDTSCGIVATAAQRQWQLAEIIANVLRSQTKVLLIGDNLQDAGNLGTIIRTAYAFQVAGLILSTGTVDCYNTKVVRSSKGAIFSLPIASKVDLKLAISELKANNCRIIALDSKAAKPFWKEESSYPRAYILGNEGHGISFDILSLVDEVVSIPIDKDSESLNVAVAAGIVLAQEKVKYV